jgi:sec-independent protein translocase protein TatA
MMLIAMFTPGPTELIVIGLVALLIFGSKLPTVAKNLGRSFVEFKRGVSGVSEELDDVKKSVSSIDEK